MMKFLDIIATLLLVVGGLNWGLWGLFEFDLVAKALGGNTALLSKAVYGLVGLAAAYQLIWLKPIQMRWSAKPLST
jgi:uncharacterized membrane protein YuzA (DUF378 family)